MQYIFTGKFKKCDNHSVLYDEYGRLYSINAEATSVFEKLLKPISMDKLLECTNLAPKKLNELMIWGIKNRLVSVYNGQKIKQDLAIYNTPNSVAIYPTYMCNQKCKFCYTNSGPDQKPNDGFLTDKRWLSVIDKLIANKVVSITLLGGEPFLNTELVLNILDKCKDKIFVRIFTNGTACGGIDESLSKKLSKYNNCEIIFSIHSHIPEEHDDVVGKKGAFHRLLESAHNIRKYTNIILSASTAVTKQNVKKLCNIAQLLEAEGFQSYDIKPFSPSARVEHFKDYFPSPVELEESIKKTKDFLSDKKMYFSYAARHAPHITIIPEPEFWGCIEPQLGGCSGDNEANIDPCGNVFRCPFVLSDQRYKIFNILDGDFANLWNNYDWKYARCAGHVKDEACLNCAWLDQCQGGCPYLSELIYGNNYSGDPYCSKVYAAKSKGVMV